MISIRARLLMALLAVVIVTSLLAGLLTYRRVLAETSTLFDYQLRQMALSLRSQIPMAPRLELPPDQADSDFVIQIWDLYGDTGLFVASWTAAHQCDRVGLRRRARGRRVMAHLRSADAGRGDPDRATAASSRGLCARARRCAW